MTRPSSRGHALALILAIALAGCVSVFPKQPPAQLYRFGVAASSDAEAPPAAGGAGFEVQRAPTTFDQAAASDRILTSNGTEAAYIAGARWLSPAVVMFDEAEAAAFDASPGPAKLLKRIGSVSAPVSLQLDVQRFEAQYPGSMAAAPTVVVRVHATLVRIVDRKVLSDRVFESRKPAGENRVGAIVRGFDGATTDVLGQIVAWTDAAGPG